MKKTIISLLIGITISVSTSCQKTYTCQCNYGNSTYTTGQVKAISKTKAVERCSGSCSGGTISVK